MVDGDYLVPSLNHLRVECADNGFLDNLRPLAASQADGLLVDGLEVALADLKHEGPVRACLCLSVLPVAGVSLQRGTLLSEPSSFQRRDLQQTAANVF